MIREGETIAGRFELLRLAGAGGMARVFEARDRNDGRILAVKIGRAEDSNEARRFLREAEVLSELSHPSIVRYVAHGRVGNDCFLAMEWLEGEDLYQRLRRGAPRHRDRTAREACVPPRRSVEDTVVHAGRE